MTNATSNNAADILQELKDGNRRFAAGKPSVQPPLPPTAPTQSPRAIVLGCADSRVPVEMIFDQAIGSLFVVRVAGNIAAPTQIGSIEFAAVSFATPLLVVLGHSGCGAVAATLQSLADKESKTASDNPLNESPHLAAITEQIRPAIAPLLKDNTAAQNSESLLTAAIAANIHATINTLQTQSNIIKNLVAEHRLTLAAATYDFATHEVNFLPANQ